ncbi:hypothetical protein RFM99_27690 [Mesorhizobium sp. VK4C]|uniref:hypothetical protein n=1 Tax=Mesorhizobium captivum TaxID=3072319 RepID=UPI002A24E847|nr:hypothetical protein [Mesorhizobium sp. VK4C]MDX8502184.1 hypothetical protein [Mesorhizobium sp. VK4C]
MAAVAFRVGDNIRVLAANLTFATIEIALPSNANLLAGAGEETEPAKSRLTSHSSRPCRSVLFDMAIRLA